MYHRVIDHFSRKIILYFSQKPCMQNNKVLVFGNPLHLSKNDLELKATDFGNTIKGYWLRIQISLNTIEITNDILGGFRVYYVATKDEIIFSDDYNFVLEKSKLPLVKHDIEYDYWAKHRFTTGGATFIKGLNKISPASIFTINSNGFSEITYFKNIVRNSNRTLFQKSLHKDLENTFTALKKSSKQHILLFSGGKDSCLLLQYLVRLNIPFKAVFFKLNPINNDALDDLLKVRAIAKQLSITVDEVEITLNELTEKQQELIVNNQLFDKHFSLLHYLGTEKLIEKYGDNILIINGQSSDSILSFGPSERSLMSYFRRNILYKPTNIISKIGVFLLNVKTKGKYRLPNNQKESLLALFDEFKYSRVIDTRLSEAYYLYLQKYIEEKCNVLSSYTSKEMYVKILSFCQGSDNQVVINSGRVFNTLVIMPFSTPNFIYSTLLNKEDNLEIKNPKYVINDILINEFNFNYNTLNTHSEKSSVTIPIDNSTKIEQKVAALFKEKLHKILAK